MLVNRTSRDRTAGGAGGRVMAEWPTPVSSMQPPYGASPGTTHHGLRCVELLEQTFSGRYIPFDSPAVCKWSLCVATNSDHHKGSFQCSQKRLLNPSSVSVFLSPPSLLAASRQH